MEFFLTFTQYEYYSTNIVYPNVFEKYTRYERTDIRVHIRNIQFFWDNSPRTLVYLT